MKSFENIDVKSVKQAVALLQKFTSEKKRHRGRRRQRVFAVDEGPCGRAGLCHQSEDHPRFDYDQRRARRFSHRRVDKLADIEEHPAVREKLLILSEPRG